MVHQNRHSFNEFSDCSFLATLLVLIQVGIGNHIMDFSQSSIGLVAEFLLLVTNDFPIDFHRFHVIFIQVVQVSKPRLAPGNIFLNFPKLVNVCLPAILQSRPFILVNLNCTEQIGSADFKIILFSLVLIFLLLLPISHFPFLSVIANYGQIASCLVNLVRVILSFCLLTAVLVIILVCLVHNLEPIVDLWEFFGIEEVNILLHFLEKEFSILEIELSHVDVEISEECFGFFHQVIELFFCFVAGHGLDEIEVGPELLQLFNFSHWISAFLFQKILKSEVINSQVTFKGIDSSCIFNLLFTSDLIRFHYNQSMDQGHQLASFKISVDKLESEFECQICFNPINDCYVTRCGHVYCKACIEETVGRHHRCPFCTQQLKQFKLDVFKNYHFNTIKKIVDQQRKVETEKYMKKVFSTDLKNKMQEENERIEELMRPIENRIVQQCQEALLHYRKFMIKLYEVEKEAEEKKLLLGSKKVRDHSEIIIGIQKAIQKTIVNPVISPDIIQVQTQIEVLLPGNKINKSILKLSPLSTFEALLPYIEKICSENNIMLKGKIDERLVVNGQEVLTTNRIGLLAGGTIKIEKGIPFEVKVYCFTYGWDKGKVSPFYSCSDCAVKWICENCALFCHENHSIKLQLKEHKSDWAICYCVSKCECKAINKNTME